MHLRQPTGDRPYIFFYVTDFTIMSNWNIVCNTNTHHIMQYCYDIVINNINYTQKSVSLKPICLNAAYGGDRCVIRSKLLVILIGSSIYLTPTWYI